ncbi:hypothetical protein DXG01_007703 [Tephrocybe rancida]|nr:hypothetical protein DXG01_007703 [Tephrocybe rancida]
MQVLASDIHRSTTLRSLDSNVTSSSDTTSSGYTARGIGSISGRAIYAIGELALQGVENLAVLGRIYYIADMLPNARAMDLKEVERLYKDLFEFSRQDLYLGPVRNLAFKILFRRICSRETDYLVRCVNKQQSKRRKKLLEELVTSLDPLRLSSAKGGRGSDVAAAYKKSLSETDVHSLLPFIQFCDKLALSPKHSTVLLLLEAGVLDFLLHAYDTKFHDPFAKSEPGASRRTTVFEMACNSLVRTIRELDVEPTVFDHPVFSRVSLPPCPSVVHVEYSGEGSDIPVNAPALPEIEPTGSPLLTFPELEPSAESPLSVSSLAYSNQSTESLVVESPLQFDMPKLHRPLPPLPFNNRTLTPTHLKVNEFGSRFLPHAMSPIRCLLALESDSLLLIGHDDGLSVINTFPQERSDDGNLTINGPDGAHARTIWLGQSVLQLSFLEGGGGNGGGASHDAVLALVGPAADSPGTKATGSRSIRIYNLESLASLARWAITRKVSTTFGACHPDEPSGTSYDLLLSPKSVASRKLTLIPEHKHHPPDVNRRSSEWDMVDETSQLQWVKDFVPLTTRLLGLSVISYALWTGEVHGGRGCLLAVATKNSIFLYESLITRRKFQFVKVELSLPSHPRSVTFCQQCVRKVHPRTSLTRPDTEQTIANDSPGSAYGSYLSLFVIFDKKACYIRLIDGTVGKAELYDGGGDRHSMASDSSTSTLRNRLSLDASSLTRWLPPVQCSTPTPEPGKPGAVIDISIITRGKDTHILPSPVSTGSSSRRPIFVTTWRSPPTSVSVRVSALPVDEDNFLQLIALGGEAGIEVQEVPLSFLQKVTKRSSPGEVLWAEEDMGGYTGFLCNGGHWDQSHHRYHRQRLSSLWTSSGGSVDSHAEGSMTNRMKGEQGVYGWCWKGAEDWRIFWVGGSLTSDKDDG